MDLGFGFKELADDQESILEKNLVLVLGFPRSGTTWLGTQLLSHNTNIVNEFRIADHLAVRSKEMGDEVVRRVDQKQNDENYLFASKFKKNWIIFLRKLILNRIYAQFRDLDHKIIIKEPNPIDVSDIISDCFEKSKIILLVRDGRDVIDSVIDAKQEDGFMAKAGQKPLQIQRRLKFIENQARLWKYTTENLLKTFDKKNNENIRLIKYERLLDNTFEELQKIYEFINVEISQNELQNIIEKYSFKKIPDKLKGEGKFYRAATPGLWKEHFSDDEKKLMNELMKDTLKKLEYEH